VAEIAEEFNAEIAEIAEGERPSTAVLSAIPAISAF